MTSTSTATQLAESASLTEATRGQQPTGRRMRIKLIDAGWGSSGYYSPKVLQQAAKDRIYPAGTQMYIDHPTMTEAVERPERSVNDLAAVFTSDAEFADDALWANVLTFAKHREDLAEKKSTIGVSIRARGSAEPGEAAGRDGMIVTRITEGTSVDFVTAAGRGGQIVSLLESAHDLQEARNVGAWLESRLHLAFTELADDMYGCGRLSRDERIGLSSAVSDALAAFVDRIEADHPQLYQRDLYDGPPESGPAHMAETTLPAPPAPTLEEHRMSGSTQPGTPASGAPTDLSEAARLRTELAETKQKLAESELRAAQLGEQARDLEETKRSLEDARRENLRLRADATARNRATAFLAESTLPEVAHDRVIAAVTGDHVPLNDDGALDEAKLVEALTTAADTERKYLARFAESEGMGTVRGLGGGTGDGDGVDLEKELGAVFAGIGLSESAAKVAAKGRA